MFECFPEVAVSINSVELKLTNNKILLPEVHDSIGYNDFKRGYMGQLPSDFDNTSKQKFKVT